VFAGVRLPEIKETAPLEKRYPQLSEVVINLAKVIIVFFSFSDREFRYYGDIVFSLPFFF
jgi:hypothetical protein